VSLRFPYKKYPSKDGKSFDLFAVLNVYIALPYKNAPRSKKIEAIIDSGACHTTFHSSIGKGIGLDINKGEAEETYGIDGKATTCYLHDISLYAPGGIIQIRAAFSDNLPVAGILGMRGFFEHFKVTFDPTAEHCEIERIFRA
jgi:hypothetical protein